MPRPDQHNRPAERNAATPLLLPGASLTSVLLTLVIGLFFTALSFKLALRRDAERLEEHLQKSVEAIASATQQMTYINPTYDAMMAAFTGIQRDIAGGQPLDDQTLRQHLWLMPPPGMEGANLLFLPRIAAADLERRESLQGLVAEPHDTALLEPGPNGLQPVQVREEYFPALLQVGYADVATDLGVDRSVLPEHQLAMQRARDSGLMGIATHFPMPGNPDDELLTYSYYPLYQGGLTPPTVETRRQALLGFAAITTRAPGPAMLELLPAAYHGIDASFVPIDSATASAGADNRLIGSLLESGKLKQANYSIEGLQFAATAEAAPTLVTSLQGNTRWWVLGIGAVCTLWVLSMLLWARAQSNKIVALVNERTHDLAVQTSALTSANIALRESENRYRMLANNISDVIFTCDVDGRCTYISPSITQQTGYQPEEYLGQSIFQHHDAESAHLMQRLMQQTLAMAEPSDVRSDKPLTNEYLLICRDGASKPLETTINTLYDAYGGLIGFLGVMRDISERKRAEQEKETLQQAYRQAQKMEAIGTLAGGIAHDFNNLLTGMLGHADLLKNEYPANSTARRSVELIEVAATRAKELTGQLLGFARKGKFMLVPVEIDKVLADLVGLLEGTFDKNVAITRDLCPGNPTVMGDPGQISQIFLNLAVNSRDAMPKGGSLQLKTDIVTLDENTALGSVGVAPGTYCLISIKDTGAGIPHEDLERIFEPFYTTKEEGKGTGLGLAMVYGVVKNHKGAINVHSEVGKGTVFKVYLPLAKAVSQEKARPALRSVITGTGKVLLVDDQPLVRTVGEQMLKKLGYQVELADNGETALDYYRGNWHDIDVVMVDMIMPKMGGIECLEAMKIVNPGLKAILSTGFSREDIAEKINESHILGFIQKPYRLQELSEVVARVRKCA